MIGNNAILNINQNSNILGPPGTYTAGVNQAVAGFNQTMMKFAEVFDPFIQQALITQPRHWLNMIPRGAFPNFNGYQHETRIFRGGLQHYAGLSAWNTIDPVSSTTNNPCARGAYPTPGYAWEKLAWTGKETTWGSDPICVKTLQYVQEAQRQLSWILQVALDYGVSIMEVWNRDFLIRTATVDAARGYVMTSSYVGNTASPKFYYDPFVVFGEGEGEVGAATGITKPFIVFKADVPVEPLNFDVLDMLHQDFDASCPSSAIGSNSGSPLYGLPVSKFDFERYIKGNPYELANWREARAEQLITGVANVKTHRDWALSFDNNQLRFKISAVVANYDSDDYGGVGAALDGETVVIAEYVAPRIEGRVGEDSKRIPEWNPEYASAELAVMPVLLNRVFTNLMGTEVSTLGSGTFFGPQPGLNGKWSWINIPDKTTNPWGQIGNFVGMYEIFPKPETNIPHSTAFLYRRCTEPIRSRCPVDNTDVNPDTATGGSADGVSYVASGADATANSFALAATLDKKLVDAAVGSAVTVTFAGLASDVEVTGYLLKASTAPVYQIFIAADGVMDVVAAAGPGYYIDSGVLKHQSAEAEVTSLTLKSVSV